MSEFQGDIDWQAVKASGVVFAVARALEGETIHDPRFPANWQGMKDAGIVRGAYDFYVADDLPADQVRVFARLVTLEPGDLVPIVDIEQGSIGQGAPPDLIANFHRYLDLMEQQFGAKPGFSPTTRPPAPSCGVVTATCSRSSPPRSWDSA